MTDFSDQIRQAVEKQMRFFAKHRERYVRAWIAHYGIHPSQAVLVEQRLDDGRCKVWLEFRKEEV